MKKQPKNVALIIVDLLEDFAEGGNLPVLGARDIADRANQILPLYENVIAVNDSHPKDHCSFKDWPVHCVQETPGAQFIKELNKNKITKSFRKGTSQTVDSYSGFMDNNMKTETGLREYLNSIGVDTVHIIGVATDYCVKWTALDANRFGFKTFVITDLIAGVNEEDSARALDNMTAVKIKFLSVTELLK